MIRRFAFASFFALSAGAAAQAPPAVVPCAVFGAEPPPCATPTPAPGTLAIVEGEAITWNELDPTLKADVEALDAKVAEARRAAVRAEAEDALLAAEAARRGSSVDALLDDEVSAKIAKPTDAEISAELTLHPERYAGRNDEAVRPAASARLEDERAERLRREFLARLEKTSPIALGADPNAPGLADEAVLATVAGRKITRRDAAPRIAAAVYRAAMPVHWRESNAVEKLVHERLLKLEAARRGVSPADVTRVEVTEKLKPPTDAEIAAAHEKYRAFFPADLAKARPEVLEYLTADRRHDAETELDRRLREGRSVRVLVEAPPHPSMPGIDVSGSPSRGPANAAVTLVEFGDFQCPPCRLMSSVVEEAWKPYESRVRFVFRQYPLDMHTFARKAAEAGLAADAQGKFFPYAHLLFAHQDALDVASLKKYAAEAGLDRAQFDRDLDSGRFAARVRRDKHDGERYGVLGTPTFFLNGVPVEAKSDTVEGLRALFDAALAGK